MFGKSSAAPSGQEGEVAKANPLHATSAFAEAKAAVAFDTLQDFVRALGRAGQLKRIGHPVSPNLEMTEIADRVVKAGGPALLFERPVGHATPVLMNAFGSMRRMAMALGVENVEEIAARIEGLLSMQPPGSLLEKARALPKLMSLAAAVPKRVRSGICQQVVDDDKPTVQSLPILTCWPEDAGPYITFGMVFTQDPETHKRNVGVYRLQVFDGQTLGAHWQIHKVAPRHHRDWEAKKRRMPVAIVIGADPAMMYAATAPLPEDMDEVVFAGFLRGSPVELVNCRSINLEVPAGAEIVLEGYVEHAERRMEGPFGDHTGFYSLPAEYPVFHLTCVTHRRHPVYAATVVGRPPMEDYFLGKATERIFLPFIRLQLPEIADIAMPPEGVFHNLAVVSIRKRYPGHAQKVMHALWGMGQMMFTKVMIVVEDDVNVQDMSEVLFVLGNHVDPERDVTIVRGPVDSLNHAAPMQDYGSKMGIDATRKWKEEGFQREWPRPIRMSREVREKVDAIWKRLGV